jgi:Leucine rich repeat
MSSIKFCFTLAIFITLTLQCHSTSNQLSCVEDFQKNVCVVGQDVTIGSPDSSFTEPNHSIDVLYFSQNPNIHFLPVNVTNLYPFVRDYQAWSCSIKAIFKNNFEGMEHLKGLDLSKNFIVTVFDDTFKGLTGLEVLNLSKFS